MDQDIIDEAVKIATEHALLGQPLEQLIWIPPQSGADNPKGNWALTFRLPASGSSNH